MKKKIFVVIGMYLEDLHCAFINHEDAEKYKEKFNKESTLDEVVIEETELIE